ncbi:NAD(P)-dependent oxidoreductase [Synechococcus sp. UW140]|uniref:NAD(P)-dependent oxidoreductase n=1 Tax=Synechococcus sp. UW140 TaxID=368503 RepID=UPI000E0E31A5|nr:NAD(P)-dependent oxidoreductase [Synechococcus sp. UW140]
MTLKVVATKFFQELDQKYFSDSLCHLPVQFHFPSNEIPINDFLLMHSGVDVFLGPPPDEQHLIRNIRSLKLVQVPWSGLDACNLSGVSSLNIPFANSHSNAKCVAEFAFSLWTSLAKYIPFHHYDLVFNGKNHRPGDKDGHFPSLSLSDSIFGIWGGGAIGRELITFLSPFAKRISICGGGRFSGTIDVDYYDKHEYIKFLKAVNVLFVCLPLSSLTRNILNKQSIQYLPRGSLVVNIARSALFDEDDLAHSLLSDHIKGFASDFNPALSSLILSNPSLRHKIIISPHRAGFVEHKLPHLDDAILNISRLATCPRDNYSNCQLINLVQ